ncbi:stage V sporulation protein AB [Gracilibacillus oryzae]|uniref:Stage V sporulation protein AB n=1 Tax=Gracilibacillus oryzae TaxID=1672701 RepID=A0A7C8KZW4_9BACI|nr:stage V sporulation protein AB [Gracilibacillus oryzae]KAB8138384.1 stage V sporulation protein AB [Gracilibacillus oryzae]
MSDTIRVLIVEIFIGFGTGIMVGSGFVAFLTVLGIIPRLVQLSKSENYLHSYQASVIVGALFGTFLSFTNVTFSIPVILLVFWGLLHGIFVGMLAAGLTEVLNVFPILMKRLGIDKELLWLLMAVVIGKIAGSIFHWTVFVDIMR